jgi:glucose/mannose-6-phosphate isomerase
MTVSFDLDDLERFAALDRDHMLAHLDALPDQLEAAWSAAQTLPLPDTHRGPRQIVLAGMGGSAIGGDLLAALIGPTSSVPLTVVRGYNLPAWVQGPETLVIASSFSGNTEETLAAAGQALERGVPLLAISTGGQLAAHAEAHHYPWWRIAYQSQPRAALGWSFGLLLGLAARLGLAAGLEADVREAVGLLRQYTPVYTATSPAPRNPAKRGAGQLIGRVPVFFGGGLFEPVARRWKCQINENAKAWAQYEGMPEANHNTVAGIGFPAEHGVDVAAVFITSPQYDHPRVTLRHELTFQLCLQNGIMADYFRPAGQSALAQMCHAIQYGDYVSFYLAMAYGADPTEIAPIMELKEQLAARE